jgi:XapX domain-containing protein
MKLVIGLFLALCVGVGCRLFGIPLPRRPAILGAAMAVAMASGYTAMDYWLVSKSAKAPPANTVGVDVAKTVAPSAANPVSNAP